MQYVLHLIVLRYYAVHQNSVFHIQKLEGQVYTQCNQSSRLAVNQPIYREGERDNVKLIVMY